MRSSSSDEELRAVVGEPPSHSVAKVVTAIDRIARTFIENAPFAFVASVGEDGRLDVSPRGDPAGFVKVLDEHTLAVPDRPGNRRLDTFHNVLRNPNVGIIFLIPGVTHTLRVSGKAIIVRDDFLRDTMKMNGKAPDHVLVVGVERVFGHCPKCMIRSGLWRPDTWGEPDSRALFCGNAGRPRQAPEKRRPDADHDRAKYQGKAVLRPRMVPAPHPKLRNVQRLSRPYRLS